MYLPLLLSICIFGVSAKINPINSTYSKRALQKEHELPQAEKWANIFFGKTNDINYQLSSLVKLLKIATEQINYCTVMVLYDSSAEDIDNIILEKLFKELSLAYVHGKIDENKTMSEYLYTSTTDKCVAYMLFLKDVMRVEDIIGKQQESKVIIVSKSSQWRIHEFLGSDNAQNIVNLLIICKSEQIRTGEIDIPYILYTHKMYVDGLGSSKPEILMSWYKNKLTKPNLPLFPKKMHDGFAGHRFIVSIADQPPFVIKRSTDNDVIIWDGSEVRMIKLIADNLNFTLEFQEAKHIEILGSSDAVAKSMSINKIDIGLAGLYVTKDRTDEFEMSYGHSHDCAAFISLTSTALPKYRAIMGPFHWTVWLALTLTYLFAIFPIAYSDRLSLKHLLEKPGEMENMFWYVFGTFTNCFTFTGKNSWNKTEKTSTRTFIGCYWIFTIIVSACYTGSIIAFVTLPISPKTVDTVSQLLSGRYQVGTLDKGGWQYWFENLEDVKTKKLFKHMEYLPDVQSGLKNITHAFFWPYAFLGSRDQLDFIVRTNFTTKKKKSVLHISEECFVPFSVSLAFPKHSVYKNSMSSVILRLVQSGLIIKIKNDVDWEIMRSSAGKLLQANSVGTSRETAPEDRALTLADTQGMFLLLGAGFIMGGASLISEWLGGCYKFCKTGKRSSYNLPQSTSCPVPTPNEKTTVEVIFNPTQSAKSTESNISVNSNLVEQESTVIVHANAEICKNDACQTDNTSSSMSDDSSDLESKISEMFNFDYLFGEDNCTITDTSNNYSENSGEHVDSNYSRDDFCNGNIN